MLSKVGSLSCVRVEHPLTKDLNHQLCSCPGLECPSPSWQYPSCSSKPGYSRRSFHLKTSVRKGIAMLDGAWVLKGGWSEHVFYYVFWAIFLSLTPCVQAPAKHASKTSKYQYFKARHDIGIILWCMQALGGDTMWFDRFAAQHAVSRLSSAR